MAEQTDEKGQPRWEWKRPRGHERQPLIEWWAEQIAVVIVLVIGKRAHRRGDGQTLARMVSLMLAGRDAECTSPPGTEQS